MSGVVSHYTKVKRKERCRASDSEWKSLFRSVTPTLALQVDALLQWLLLACTILSCSLNLALINIQ